MFKLLTILCVVTQFAVFTDAARILVYLPFPSISHQVVYRSFIQELVKRGHEVVQITCDPAYKDTPTPANFKEIDVHDVSYKTWTEGVVITDRGNKDGHVSLFLLAMQVAADVFESQIRTPQVQEVLKQKFDLIMIEALARPALSLSHIFKTPVILLSTLGALLDNYEVMGAPTHPLLYPNPYHRKLHNLTLQDKISELLNHYDILKVHDAAAEYDEKVVRRLFGPSLPPLDELKNNVDMLYLNMHPIFEGNHPVPPSVIHVWGIYEKPSKEIPKDLKAYLDSSKNGVIYMSFGTNTDPTFLSKEKMQMFKNVFAKLPYDVIWKWNLDEMEGKPKNVKIGKWFPQADLLKHPKVKVFITQCGLQSTDEALTAGVPLIGVPMLGDQWYNAAKYIHLGIGTKLEWDTLTEASIREAIETIVNNDSYRTNIKKIDALMKDQPMSAMDRAIFWTEHVLRHGGAKHLRSPAANMGWWEYLEMDLLLILLSIILAIVIIVFLLIRFLYKLVFGTSSKPKVKKN